jgi:outer membrane beta-barrel protein
MRWTLVLLLVSGTVFADAQKEPEADFDSLGGNTILLNRAKALEPEKNVSIVQKRVVDRRHRLEIAPEFAGTFGGDAYSHTKTVGLNLNYHFTPKFSVGLKYNYAFNSLTTEGEAMVDKAYADFVADPENPDSPYPEIDYMKDEALAMLNWYPFYGKLKISDRNVVHFDVYALGGGGQARLLSGPTTTYTAGGGIGFWVTQHFTTRLEMRWQNYTAKYLTGEKDLDLTIGSLQMGWLL